MKSIRKDLSIALLAAILGVFAAAGAGFYFYVRSALLGQFDESLIAETQALATLAEIEEDGTIEFEFEQQQFPQFTRAAAPDFFQLWGDDGSVLQSSASMSEASLELKTGSMDEPAVWDLQLPNRRPGRAAGVRFTPRVDTDDYDTEDGSTEDEFPEMIGEARLVLAKDRGHLDRTLAVIGGALLFVVACVPVLIILLVLGLVGRGLRPVARIAAEARAIDERTLDRRLSTGELPAELMPIAEQFNALLDRLRSAFMRERRFTADVAHELRTPVAELRSTTEVAIRWPDDEETASFLPQNALQIALQMERLVENLLRLSQSQSGSLRLDLESVDVEPLINSIWALLESRALERRLRANIEAEAGLGVVTDRAILGGIISNLLDNAVEHSPERGEVNLRARRAGGGIEICVVNTNETIGEGDLAFLVEPFWRKDAARTDGNHAGLGLALADEFARILGGTLKLGLDAGGRFSATVSLPITERAPRDSVENMNLAASL